MFNQSSNNLRKMYQQKGACHRSARNEEARSLHQRQSPSPAAAPDSNRKSSEQHHSPDSKCENRRVSDYAESHNNRLGIVIQLNENKRPKTSNIQRNKRNQLRSN